MPGVFSLRVVPVRLMRQLPLPLPALPPYRGAGLPVLDERDRGTRFVALASRTALNSPAQTGMDFWSLNPYVGCEFGCTYCYARYAHRYVVERAHAAGRLSDQEFADFRGAHGWEAFERRIFVKRDLLGALESDLKRMGGSDQTIVIGTATDPYQPAERRFRITRQALERLARCEGLSVGIITKSPLVVRDTPVLLQLQRRNALEVYISLVSVDAPLVRLLEARSPVPAARLRAVRKLAAAGVNVGVIVAPVLPGITDDLPRLEALFQAARDAGARFICAGPLRLYAAVRDRFLPVLAAHFPQLADRYRVAYARGSSAPRDYARALSRRVKRLQARFGFTVSDGMVDRYKTKLPVLQGTLELR
jgi:DNA repair photolyase